MVFVLKLVLNGVQYYAYAMKTVVIIPARYASTRLPGKPLALIAGKSLLQRVWEISCAAEHISGVYVATDDHRVAEHAASFRGNGFGANVIMTPQNCANGTERAAAASQQLPEKPDAIINMQGDAVLTPPWIISALAKTLQTTTADMVTASVALSWEQAAVFAESKKTTPASGTLVVTTPQNRALYFSKNMIPFVRKKPATCPYKRHIGIYGYRYNALQQFTALPESPLEIVEGLEQLRALENNLFIEVTPVDYQGRSHGSIDSPEDILRIEDIIRQEGELV